METIVRKGYKTLVVRDGSELPQGSERSSPCAVVDPSDQSTIVLCCFEQGKAMWACRPQPWPGCTVS